MLKSFVLLISLIFSLSSFALPFGRVEVPETVTVNGKTLKLNGQGIRRATFLNVQVYMGSLYLPNKANSTEEVLSLPFPKYISMIFVRDADKKSLQEKWTNAFNRSVPEERRKKLIPYLDQLNQMMIDIKKKQSILLTFLDTGVEIVVNGKKHGRLGNKDFSHALFSVWFINPEDEKLKAELLGKN